MISARWTRTRYSAVGGIWVWWLRYRWRGLRGGQSLRWQVAETRLPWRSAITALAMELLRCHRTTVGVSSNAETVKGAMAEAQSVATPGQASAEGQASSSAKTSFAGVSVQSSALATNLVSFYGPLAAATNAIVQGGSGQAFVNFGQTALCVLDRFFPIKLTPRP